MVIKPLNAQILPYAQALTINQEQSQFVDSVSKTIQSLKHSEHPCIIATDEAAESTIGFFLFDSDYANQYDFAKRDDLGLRALLIDKKHQGKGFGYQSMLAITRFAQEQFPGYGHICLTVNEKNSAAYHCYTKAGYQDKGERYLGGSAGPQHILRLPLTKG